MAETGNNKRRSRNNDKFDKPKARKLAPVTPLNTRSYLQILGTGMDTQDTCPSVLLFFDKQRFIFNAGEGLQRYCTEHKIKLSKIDHIFLSRVSSETAGGLPGLLLTMSGIGDKGMCVKMWGPPGLDALVNAMNTFVPSAAMVHTKSFGPTPQPDGLTIPDPKKFSGPFDLIDDEVVKISAILLSPNENNGPAFHKDISVIYVCELPQIPGKFHPEKAEALGLKPGPKYRELQNGVPVKLKDDEVDPGEPQIPGKFHPKKAKARRLKHGPKNRALQENIPDDIMVHPRDVMDPPTPGPVVLLVDCPTMSHFQSLLSADTLNIYYKDYLDNMSETYKEVNCVVHLSPSSVSNNSDYQKWMKRFGSAQHIMAGHESKNAQIPVLKASARISARLNYLCPWLFPASGFLSHHDDNCSLHSNSSTEGAHAVISAENLLKFNLRPHANLGLDRSSIPIATGPAEIEDELRAEIPEIADAVKQVKQLWDHHRSCSENISREDMEIVLLGTGSSQPSKYRNVSSIFINLFSKGGLLLDCGEGTLGQLKRRFGVKEADNVVKNLSCIWISHIHADHHTGLSRILALRRDLQKDVPHEPLLVIGPGQLLRFLDAYQRLENLDIQFLDCKFTTRASWDSFEKSHSRCDQSSPSNSESSIGSTLVSEGSLSYCQKPDSLVANGLVDQRLNTLRKVLQKAGLETLISVPVDHFWEALGGSPQAFGVSLTAQRSNSVSEIGPGWKIVYSGDTRPCPQLIEEAQGATVLIHEATFEDEMVGEAIAKKHSTTKEAIDVGEQAGVYRIILTHFSQRYPKIPVFGDSHMHNTCIGFDLMTINLADLRVFPQVLPHLKLLFRNEMAADELDEPPLEEVSAAS